MSKSPKRQFFYFVFKLGLKNIRNLDVLLRQIYSDGDKTSRFVISLKSITTKVLKLYSFSLDIIKFKY